MKAGDIVFVRGHSWLDDAIKYFDPGEFSHVAIAVSDTEVFESLGGSHSGTRIDRMSYTDYEIISTNLTEAQIGRLQVLCQLLEGKPYDYVQDLGYIFVDWFHINEDRFNNPDALICSEAVALVLYLLGTLTKALRNITPNQLAGELEKVLTI